MDTLVLTSSEYFVLIGAALVTSIISGFTSMAGGIALLTVMAGYLPGSVLVPLHGVVQLSSNLSRVVLLWKDVNRVIIPAYIVGGILGAAIGSQFVVQMDGGWYKVTLGAFIIVLTWLPKFKTAPKIKGKWVLLGGTATFLSLFFGAIGPLLAPFFLREDLKKEGIVATKAACQVIAHILKITVFTAMGFAFAPYWKLLLGMVVAVIIGNTIGKQLLGKVNERVFRMILKVLITGLAARMIFMGFR